MFRKLLLIEGHIFFLFNSLIYLSFFIMLCTEVLLNFKLDCRERVKRQFYVSKGARELIVGTLVVERCVRMR